MLKTDALDGVIVVIYSQKQPNIEWHLVVYYLKTIINAELNYHIHDKEMLAIIFSF